MPDDVTDRSGTSRGQAALLDAKLILGSATALGVAFLLMLFLGSSHGRWNNLLPTLLIVGIYLVVTLIAVDRQRVWWRQVVSAPLNVGLAVALALLPINVLIQIAEQAAHLLDGVIAQLLVPLGAATLAAIISALKATAQRTIRLVSHGSGDGSA